MNNSTYLQDFTRQSSKGILVIYMNLIYKFLKATWILLFLFIKDFSKFNADKLFYIGLGSVFLLLFLLIRSYLLYKNFVFKIDNEEFILKQGILKKTKTSISFDRIQNINLKQNLIQQLINVYEVSLETAGSNKTEISIKALTEENALYLKNSIGNVKKKIIEEETEKPLVKIGVTDLLKVSLSENHIRSLLLLLALLLGLFQQLEQVFKSIGVRDSLDEAIDQGASVFLESVILFSILLGLLLVAAVISSFVRVFLVHFNLSLVVRNTFFEINQGLFTKKSIVLKKSKIQNFTISTNPIKRRLGISFITFKQAISGKVQSKKKDKLIRVVGCKDAEVKTISDFLIKTEAIGKTQKEFSDHYFKYRMLFQSSIFLLIINVLLFFSFHSYNALFSNLILVPLFLFLIHKKFKKRFFRIAENEIMVASGLIETHYTFFEMFKVQNVKMKQTIFQKRKEVADVILQSASGKISIPCLPKSRALEIYNLILFKVETDNRTWM